MKKDIINAIKGGLVLFIFCNIPLFLIGLYLNSKVLIINFDFTTITPYIYIIIPIFGALIFIIGGRVSAKSRRKGVFGAVCGPPTFVVNGFKLSKVFGVNWRILVGLSSVTGNSFYVEGCYCPNCDCKLMTETKNTFFGWGEKYLWKCSGCGFKIKRPKGYLWEEEEAVENVAKREYEKKQLQ